MIRSIPREYGNFEVREHEFFNLYYTIIFEGAPCASVHLQLNIKEQYAYCHIYFEKFSLGIAKEIKKDWLTVLHIMRTYGINKAIGTKVDGIKMWSKFIKMLGFKDEAEQIVMNNQPVMMAVMEF